MLYKASHQTEEHSWQVSLSEAEFIQDSNAYDTNPLIYFRLTKPLKAGCDLPKIYLTKCYEQTSKYGYQFKVQPDLRPIRNDKLIETFKDDWRELSEAMDKFTTKSQQAILKQMDS